jgi:hypothetical protein
MTENAIKYQVLKKLKKSQINFFFQFYSSGSRRDFGAFFRANSLDFSLNNFLEKGISMEFC